MQGKKQRIAMMSALLAKNPNKLYSLNYFKEMFGAAKSSISEDAAVLKQAFLDADIGRVETVAGAHGGIRYVPEMPARSKSALKKELIAKMSDTSRILPGGYMYLVDLFCTPYYVDGMAQIIAPSPFCATLPLRTGTPESLWPCPESFDPFLANRKHVEGDTCRKEGSGRL